MKIQIYYFPIAALVIAVIAITIVLLFLHHAYRKREPRMELYADDRELQVLIDSIMNYNNGTTPEVNLSTLRSNIATFVTKYHYSTPATLMKYTGLKYNNKVIDPYSLSHPLEDLHNLLTTRAANNGQNPSMLAEQLLKIEETLRSYLQVTTASQIQGQIQTCFLCKLSTALGVNPNFAGIAPTFTTQNAEVISTLYGFVMEYSKETNQQRFAQLIGALTPGDMKTFVTSHYTAPPAGNNNVFTIRNAIINNPDSVETMNNWLQVSVSEPLNDYLSYLNAVDKKALNLFGERPYNHPGCTTTLMCLLELDINKVKRTYTDAEVESSYKTYIDNPDNIFKGARVTEANNNQYSRLKVLLRDITIDNATDTLTNMAGIIDIPTVALDTNLKTFLQSTFFPSTAVPIAPFQRLINDLKDSAEGQSTATDKHETYLTEQLTANDYKQYIIDELDRYMGPPVRTPDGRCNTYLCYINPPKIASQAIVKPTPGLHKITKYRSFTAPTAPENKKAIVPAIMKIKGILQRKAPRPVTSEFIQTFTDNLNAQVAIIMSGTDPTGNSGLRSLTTYLKNNFISSATEIFNYNKLLRDAIRDASWKTNDKIPHRVYMGDPLTPSPPPAGSDYTVHTYLEQLDTDLKYIINDAPSDSTDDNVCYSCALDWHLVQPFVNYDPLIHRISLKSIDNDWTSLAWW